MQPLFISDLHLDPTRPTATRAFIDFLAKHRGKNDLYILGDLFEAWIGDDDPDPHHTDVVTAMSEFVSAGSKGFLMHGNRDFLIGDMFCERTGFSLLADPTVIQIGGNPVLLMHGDTLCTEDLDYQAFRGLVRDPKWQADFLARTIEQRREFAAQARDASKSESSQKSAEIMDVTAKEVDRVMQAHHVSQLIHGHTHRPNVHEWQKNGTRLTRIVLGDWYKQGSVLQVKDGNFDLQFFDF